MIPKLGDVDFGAPDANQEYSWSLASKKPPAYMDAFVEEDIPLSDFREGKRWIALGHKGSGKTALLRHISETSERDYEYILFRDEIAEEKDIFTEAFLRKSPIILEDKDIHECKHYHHVMKRLLTCIILGKMPFEKPSVQNDDSFINKAVRRLLIAISSSKNMEVISEVFDSVTDIVASVQIDPEKLQDSGVIVDARKILKRENDRLLSKLIEEAKGRNFSANVYVDEVHFSFKKEDVFKADATLIRDLIDASNQLNMRFRAEDVNIQIFLGIRSEFLENPIISSSEVNNIISSVAHRMSWATMPFDNRHPCFDILRKRIFRSMSGREKPRSFRDVKIEESYLANVSADQFLRGVFGKPREAIRFFCAAAAMYPNKITLNEREYAAVFREFSNQAWAEIQTSLSSFLSNEEITSFEVVLRTLAERSYGNKMPCQDAEPHLMEFWKKSTLEERKIEYDEFRRMIYMLGIYQTSFQTGFTTVYHAYYRGNTHPSHDGLFRLSDSVERKFR